MSSKKHKGLEICVPSGLTSEAIEHYYEALDCPRSLTAYLLFKYKEYDQLVGLTCDPSHYNQSETFRDAYLSSCLLSSARFLRTSFDKKALAISKFLAYEEVCAKTNLRFRSMLRGKDDSFLFGSLLNGMRRKIAQILGRFDPQELLDESSWGPGVSTLLKGEDVSAPKKFQFEIGITRDLYPLVADLFPAAYPGWWDHLNRQFIDVQTGEVSAPGFHFEKGNRVVTVPKTSKIDRVIAIEPGLNLWFQLGIFRMMKRRLGRFGIDLTDQSKNQRLAKEASISGDLVTVDFSSASDSISSTLVFDLFNTSDFEGSSDLKLWYDIMDITRSKYGEIDGSTFRWNKFSSMGNGFTFSLESLIFYAAAFSCCEARGVSTSQISVYGDDVVIPKSVYDLFSSFSDHLGFEVNPRKSFSDGYFRESCGSHYYRGLDCKPVYLKNELSSFQAVSNFANTVRLTAHTPGLGCEARFRTLFYKLKGAVPKKFRFSIPASWNSSSARAEPLSGGFCSNLDEACPPLLRYSSPWEEGFSVRRIAWIAVKRDVYYDGLLFTRLKSPAVDKAEHNSVPLRGRTRMVLVTTPIRQWYDLGPWI